MIFLKCKICFIYIGFNCKRKKWGKKMSGNFAIKGGGDRTPNGKCHLKFPFWFSAHLPYCWCVVTWDKGHLCPERVSWADWVAVEVSHTLADLRQIWLVCKNGILQIWEKFDLFREIGKPSGKKSAVFLNIVQKAFDPPPPLFEHSSYFAGGVF